MISIYLFIIIIQYINTNTIRIVVLASVTGWTRALPLSRLPNIFFSLPSVKAVRGVNEELQKDHCLEAHERICAQINSARQPWGSLFGMAVVDGAGLICLVSPHSAPWMLILRCQITLLPTGLPAAGLPAPCKMVGSFLPPSSL